MSAPDRRPAILFYSGDWLKDPSLRACGLAARGLWIDMLCFMHQSPDLGHLRSPAGKPLTIEQLSRMTGSQPSEVSALVAELESLGVCSRTEDGAIYCRRMVRDEEKRRLSVEAGKKGGNPALKPEGRVNPPDKGGEAGGLTPGLTGGIKLSSSSSSSSSSRSKDSCPEPAEPASGPEVEATTEPPTDPPLMTFPCSGTGPREWSLTAEKLAEWVSSFPGVNVEAQLRKARQWLLDNPNKKKTHAGMTRFLGRWLGNAQDSGVADAAKPQPAPRANGPPRATKAADIQHLI